MAYSGGLDTSVILKWLEEKYECEVVTFTADLGQGAELDDAKEKAKSHGVKEIFIEDLAIKATKLYRKFYLSSLTLRQYQIRVPNLIAWLNIYQTMKKTKKLSF